MPAYVVFAREETRDPAELQRYSDTVKPSFDHHAVRFLAAYGAHEVLEGPPIEGAVILEFPDADAARAWYLSPAYQQAAQHRFQSAVYRAFIIDGVKSPD